MWEEQEYENFYEGDLQLNQRQAPRPNQAGAGVVMGQRQTYRGRAEFSGNVNDATSTQQAVNKPSTEKPENLAKLVGKKYVAVIVGLLILIAISVVVSLAMICVLMRQVSEMESNKFGRDSVLRSCLELKETGIQQNGVYRVATKVEGYEIDVFCDMETDGGGWTLVASVHEDDINEKCGIKDRWSTYVPPGFVGIIEKTGWENKRTFGNVNECSTEDYKNEAYSELYARDVMMWHVPSGSSISNMKNLSGLRYRTTNHFLERKGKNLYGLFKDRYPLTKLKRTDLSVEKSRTRRVIDALYAMRNTLKSTVPNWDEYTFTRKSGEYDIADSTLYSTNDGNKISFSIRRRYFGNLQYETDYVFPERFVVETKRAQPFILATAISNAKGSSSDYFRTRVYSSLRDPSYANVLMENNVTFHNFELQYRAVQYFHPAYPSICEFHFIVLNEKEWDSSPPKRFNRTYQYNSSSSVNYYSDFTVEGNSQNFVMGYLLLTRTVGNKFTTSHTDAIANVVMDALSPLSDLFNEEIPLEGYAVPIKFDKGNVSTILNMVPPFYRPYVEPGFIQFTAYNLTGYPSAVCPGMRMKSFNPEYMCIGGVSQDVREKYGTCGDFAGWGGKDGDVINATSSIGHAHSRSDISSVILIFYR